MCTLSFVYDTPPGTTAQVALTETGPTVSVWRGGGLGGVAFLVTADQDVGLGVPSTQMSETMYGLAQGRLKKKQICSFPIFALFVKSNMSESL